MFDPSDRGFEHGRVGRIARLDVVIDDHAVFVVDDLCLVTELDGLAEPAFGDRPRVGVMQRHDAGRAVGGGACEPLAALFGDLRGALGELFEPVDEPTNPTGGRLGPRRRQPASCVAHHPVGVACDPVGDASELAVDPLDFGELVVAAASQVRVDRPRPRVSRAGPVHDPGAGRVAETPATSSPWMPSG